MKKRQLDRMTARVDEILWSVWDPIGVNDVPEARNEYSGYAGRVAARLLRGDTDDQIARYPRGLVLDSMGLPGVNPEREAATLAVLREAAGRRPPVDP